MIHDSCVFLCLNRTKGSGGARRYLALGRGRLLQTSVCAPKDVIIIRCDVQANGSGGARGYLAVSGGLDVPVYLGSRATFPGGALGGVQARIVGTQKMTEILHPTCGTSSAALTTGQSTQWQAEPLVLAQGLLLHQITRATLLKQSSRFCKTTLKNVDDCHCRADRSRRATTCRWASRTAAPSQAPRCPPRGAHPSRPPRCENSFVCGGSDAPQWML